MRHLLAAAALAVLSALPASAQQIQMISGFVDDTTVGPLTDDFVYHVQGNSITVRAGFTLTIEDGVVIKFPANAGFNVNGTLIAGSGGGGGIVLTSLSDGTVGGGTGSGAPGDWSGVDIGTSDSSVVMDGVEIRYAGGAQGTAVLVRSSAGSFVRCVVRDSAGHGFNFGNSGSNGVQACEVHDCAGVAFRNTPWETLERFIGPVATGNAGGNWVEVQPTVPAGGSYFITRNCGVDGVIHPNGNLRVSAGSELTMLSGVIVKLQPGGLVEAFGRVITLGAAQGGALFTSEFDDSAGGDSNGDGGATQAMPGDWFGARFWGGSSASDVRGLTIRYGGAASGAGLSLFSSDAWFTDLVVERSAGDGIRISDAARPRLDAPRIRDNGGTGIAACPIQALDGIDTPAMTGNGKNQLRVTRCVMQPGDVVEIDGTTGPFGTVVLAEPLSVPDGAILNIAANAIIKNSPGVFWSVAGRLRCRTGGFGGAVITSEFDDTFGGDSDGSPSTGMPGDWRGIEFLPTSDGSFIRTALIRFGGAAFPAIKLTGCEVEVSACIIESFAGVGIGANGNPEPCDIRSNWIRSCGGEAIGGVPLDALPDFVRNHATGNGADRLRAVGFGLTESIALDQRHGIGGVVHLENGIWVQQGVTLTLEPDVVLKMGQGARFVVSGSLFTYGYEGAEVFVTDLRDDYRGDTNGDGNLTAPSAGWWRGVELTSTTSPSRLEGFVAAFGGGGSVPQVLVRSPLVDLEFCTSFESQTDGFRIEGPTGVLTGLLSYWNLGDGIELTGGPFVLRQATAAENDGCGIRAGAGATGEIRDSVAYGNLIGDWCGFVTNQLFYCNGDPNAAGSNGNIDVDPGFVDPANGDFTLLPNSLMIDRGSPASPLDPDGSRADIGGRPFNRCGEPTVYCAQAAGPGCPVTLDLAGFASASSEDPFRIRLGGAPTQQFGLFFYGTGPVSQTATAFGDLCVAGSLVRMPVIAAGGDLVFGACAGTFEVDLNPWIQSGIDPGLAPGVTVRGQFWYRDLASGAGARFSPAVEATICP